MESCENTQVLERKGIERRKLTVGHKSLRHNMHLKQQCKCAWGRGAETALGVRMQTAVFTHGGLVYPGRGNNEVKIDYWLCSFKYFHSRQSHKQQVCDRQENDVQSMVSQEKAVSATDYCAHPQEVNEELHGFCFKWSWTVIPGDLRADIMQWIHISHLGIETCLRWARKCIYRPGMNTQLKA